MDSLSSAPGKQDRPQNNRVRLVQRGKGTLTGSRMREGLRETQIHKWGKAQNLGEFDSLEAATAAANEALEKNRKATFMLVTQDEVVLAEKFDAVFLEKQYVRSEHLIKTVFFLVCTLVLGVSFYASGIVTTWWALVIWMAGLYLVLWLVGLIFNSVESCVAAIVLTTNACLFFPLLTSS